VNEYFLKADGESWVLLTEKLLPYRKYNSLLTTDAGYPWGRVNWIYSMRFKGGEKRKILVQCGRRRLLGEGFEIRLHEKAVEIVFTEDVDVFFQFAFFTFHEQNLPGSDFRWQCSYIDGGVAREGVGRVRWKFEGLKASLSNNWLIVEFPEEKRRGYEYISWLWEALRLKGRGRVLFWVEDEGEKDLQATVLSDEIFSSNEGLSRGDIVYSFLTDGLVNAGYPWFEVWGRDSAIFGMQILESGFEREALKILEELINNSWKGLVWHRFSYKRVASYTLCADATLWTTLFAEKLSRALGNESIKGFVEFFEEVFSAYWEGWHDWRAQDIFELKEVVRDRKNNYTWMDTPYVYRGKSPIELSFLWFEFVNWLRELDKIGYVRSSKVRDRLKLLYDEERWLKMLCDLYFVNEKGWFADGIDWNGDQLKILRPNQFMLLKMDRVCREKEFEKTLLGSYKKVRDLLVRPFGVLTLAPNEENFIAEPAYAVSEFDKAYHNGCAWPFLGWFVNEKVDEEFLKEHLSNSGVGFVSEVFTPSGEARGCPFQAWSVWTLIQ